MARFRTMKEAGRGNGTHGSSRLRSRWLRSYLLANSSLLACIEHSVCHLASLVHGKARSSTSTSCVQAEGCSKVMPALIERLLML